MFYFPLFAVRNSDGETAVAAAVVRGKSRAWRVVD